MPLSQFSKNGSYPDMLENTNAELQDSSSISAISDTFHELLHTPVPLPVRWGLTFFFVIVILILAIFWKVQYPETVLLKSTLHAINSPKEIRINTDASLLAVFVQEDQWVKKGDKLGVLESLADNVEVSKMEHILNILEDAVKNDKEEPILQYLDAPLKNLGELQVMHHTLIKDLLKYTEGFKNGYLRKKRNMLTKDLDFFNNEIEILNSQYQIEKNDIQLSMQQYEISKALFNQQLLSTQEYNHEQAQYLQKQLIVPAYSSKLLAINHQIHETKKQILEMDFELSQLHTNLLQSIRSFSIGLSEWRKKYELYAPVEGTVHFPAFINVHQLFDKGELFCYIQPLNTIYYAEMNIPQQNFGKLKEGLDAKLKINAYPFQEFGKIPGIVSFISPIPSDSGYLAKVLLKDGLKSDLNKHIVFREGLTSDTEIILEDKSLLEHLLFKTRSP